jgi:hypothetical protein
LRRTDYSSDTEMRIVLDGRTATDHFPGDGRYAVNLASDLARNPAARQAYNRSLRYFYGKHAARRPAFCSACS